ncbi:hypothetical protein [Chitinophaga sp. Cy-1792]|uniref:hypothetical protein n=1 Tax=Chitinophaga sp. Cy-1792 TaxID=2608339 RepID=UPI00141EF477|nr:hypothetical protein [Chitinophaga sp. Cy-1792]NIG52261.1 hypothetical protein [Chitinophaga sp. Cy-1792]
MLKYLLFIAFCCVFAYACQESEDKKQHNDQDTAFADTPDPIAQLNVNPLPGYFVKNNITVSDSLTFWVIDNQQQFDSIFGMAKTMKNDIPNPDLGTQVVIAATMPATYYQTQISLDSSYVNTNDNSASLYFSANGQDSKSSSSIVPLWLGSIPKNGKTVIKLYNGGQLVSEVKEKE